MAYQFIKHVCLPVMLTLIVGTLSNTAQATNGLHTKANKAFGLSKSAFIKLNKINPSMHQGPAKPVEFNVKLKGQQETLTLTPTSVRTKHFKVLLQQADGSLEEIAPAPSKTYRGQIKNKPGSQVSAAMTDSGLKARILDTDGDELWIRPMSKNIIGSTLSDHVLFRQADATEAPGTCAAHEHPGLPIDYDTAQFTANNTPSSTETESIETESLETESAQARQTSQLQRAEIAIDADYEYFQAWGSSETNTQEAIERIINDINIQYERDVNITYQISTLIIRTTPNTYTSNTSADLLNELRSQWSLYHSDIERDIVHLFTGKNLIDGAIGIAWMGVVCNSQYAYGLSKHLSNPASAAILTAHELGHNWSAPHCDCLDYTMHPYLSNIATKRFDPNTTIPAINSFKQNLTCLATPPPPAAPKNLTVSIKFK